jgi:hypothetical protein
MLGMLGLYGCNQSQVKQFASARIGVQGRRRPQVSGTDVCNEALGGHQLADPRGPRACFTTVSTVVTHPVLLQPAIFCTF